MLPARSSSRSRGRLSIFSTMTDRPVRACNRPDLLLREQSIEVGRKRKREDELRLEADEKKRALRDVRNAKWLAGRPAHIQMRVRVRIPEPPPRLGWNEDPPPRADELGVWHNGAYYRRGYAPIEEARLSELSATLSWPKPWRPFPRRASTSRAIFRGPFTTRPQSANATPPR
jgi:hypothetical protein